MVWTRGHSVGSRIAMYGLAMAVPVVSVLALASVGPRDVWLNGRYVLANRAEAKRLRREEAQRKPAENRPPDLPL